MKTLLSSLMLLAIFSAFIGCSDGGGGSDNPPEECVGTDCDIIDDPSKDPIPNPVDPNSPANPDLKSAANALRDHKWDQAVSFYEAAYSKDNENIEAIIYSTLANLAMISVDPAVQTLVKDRLGFTGYPNKLNALFSDDWMTQEVAELEWDYRDNTYGWVEWYEEGDVYWDGSEYKTISQAGYYYYDCQGGCGYKLATTTPKYSYTSLPKIVAPNWVQGEGSFYNNSLLGSNKVFSVDNYAIALLANVLDKNTSGANNLIDEVTGAVFGTYYDKAAERLSKLENRREERFSLNPKFIETFDLDEFFDEYDQIGWAEVNAIMSAMLAIKASFEWIASYDLDTDLSWLKGKWEDNSNYWLTKFEGAEPNKFPFNNNFLKARSNASDKIAASKADYIKAIEGLQASYAAIQSSQLYPSKVKNAYNTLNAGAEQMKSAISGGGKFYVIKDDPTKTPWPTSSAAASVTIDLGKFFTPGYFAVDKIFEVDGTGKPVFYTDRDHQKLTAGNYVSLLETQDLTLKLNVSYIRAVADTGENDGSDIEFVDTDIDGEVAKAIFEKYYN